MIDMWDWEITTSEIEITVREWKTVMQDFKLPVENEKTFIQTSITRTLIIRISGVSGLFLWSQFFHEYLLVMIKIRNHILFKTTAFKCEGKASLFRIKKSKSGPRTPRN